jgi:uncharacterized protein YvpB
VRRRTQLAALVAAAVIAVVVIAPWLWRQEVIELPPAAVKGIGRVAGLMSGQSADTVQLPAVWHRQEHSLSCEVAALKMALGVFGIDVAEAELIAALPFDSTPKGLGVWGDPQQGFVGDLDGKMFDDGYGVYWQPIARLGLRWRRTEVIADASAAEVAKHLAAGRPVIMWGYFGRGRGGSWQTPGGRTIQAVDGEHTRTVIGFSGPVGSPTAFTLLDPLVGSLSWPTEKFMENWSRLGRAGVVVYPHPRWVRAAGTGRVWEISRDGTTRHWVRRWEDFVASGGYKEAIVVVDEADLAQYTQGSDVEI